MMNEAGRQGAKGLIRWPITLLMVAQLLGIGVILPSMFVPFYILLEKSFENKNEPRLLPKERMYLFYVISLIGSLTVVLNQSLPTTSNSFVYANVLLQFSPILYLPLSFLEAPLTTSKQQQSSLGELGSRLAQLHFFFSGGMSFLTYLQDLVGLFIQKGVIPTGRVSFDDWLVSISSFPFSSGFSHPLTVYLILDIVGVWLAFSIIVFHDRGFLFIFILSILALFVSPGASMALYFALREYHVSVVHLQQKQNKQKQT